MATNARDCESFTLVAGADLSAKEGCFGKQSAGKAAVCSVLGERADFVIGNAPAAGEATDCLPRAGKIVPVRVGAVAVAQDDEITTDGNGLAITAVATNIVRGKALAAGGAGETIQMLWVDAYIKP